MDTVSQTVPVVNTTEWNPEMSRAEQDAFINRLADELCPPTPPRKPYEPPDDGTGIRLNILKVVENVEAYKTTVKQGMKMIVGARRPMGFRLGNDRVDTKLRNRLSYIERCGHNYFYWRSRKDMYNGSTYMGQVVVGKSVSLPCNEAGCPMCSQERLMKRVDKQYESAFIYAFQNQNPHIITYTFEGQGPRAVRDAVQKMMKRRPIKDAVHETVGVTVPTVTGYSFRHWIRGDQLRYLPKVLDSLRDYIDTPIIVTIRSVNDHLIESVMQSYHNSLIDSERALFIMVAEGTMEAGVAKMYLEDEMDCNRQLFGPGFKALRSIEDEEPDDPAHISALKKEREKKLKAFKHEKLLNEIAEGKWDLRPEDFMEYDPEVHDPESEPGYEPHQQDLMPDYMVTCVFHPGEAYWRHAPVEAPECGDIVYTLDSSIDINSAPGFIHDDTVNDRDFQWQHFDNSPTELKSFLPDSLDKSPTGIWFAPVEDHIVRYPTIEQDSTYRKVKILDVTIYFQADETCYLPLLHHLLAMGDTLYGINTEGVFYKASEWAEKMRG